MVGEGVETAVKLALQLRTGTATVPVALRRVPHSSLPRKRGWRSPRLISTGARLWATPQPQQLANAGRSIQARDDPAIRDAQTSLSWGR
jgi:hypothetical protein